MQNDVIVVKPKKVFGVIHEDQDNPPSVIKIFLDEELAKEYCDWCKDCTVKEYVIGDLADYSEKKAYLVKIGLKWVYRTDLLAGDPPENQEDEIEYGIEKYMLGQPMNYAHYGILNNKRILVVLRTVLAKDYNEDTTKPEMMRSLANIRQEVERSIRLGKKVNDIKVSNIGFISVSGFEFEDSEKYTLVDGDMLYE